MVFLYKQGDWKNLADGMFKIASDKQLYNKLKFFHDDLSDFNDKKMIEQHIDLYQNLI